MRQFIFILLVVALALLLPYSLKAQEQPSIVAPSQPAHLEASRVGDLLTILFMEDSSARGTNVPVQQ